MTDNLKGILWMIAAMAGFALGDVGIKALAALHMPLGQIMMGLGAGGTLGFALWTRGRGLPLVTARLWHPAILCRYVAEVLAALCMVLALALTPLSSVTAILQAAPLVVTIGAALIFKEGVGWRRWLAIAVGLAGVLLILRPGTEAFSPLSLFAVGAMLSLAARDLATRAVPREVASLQLATVGFSALILAGAVLVPFGDAFVPAGVVHWSWMAFTVLTTIGGYYAITVAMRVGEISAVSPFRYTRLLFGLALGVTLFGERPDGWMLIGSAVVVGSGIYAVLRERQLARG
ncbi:DMT family transporter [Pseudaestuariivita atlantica]|uniref:EamA domain-containing protein n=1 Tax=Pseudaestuariivita atlantica TaxID=1317121 RepID=A0A0L1JM86_9RHOB|nr:DMT family transporter [Pseudaestuariivita atlantica]KNG92503.1 hypothetical protein ATO11_17330 [Pseudaestuariivita atlantica]